MKDFDTLNRIIQKLTDSEHKYIQNVLSKNQNSILNNPLLSLNLYKLIRKNSDINYIEAEKILYRNGSKDAFGKLVIRLTDKILDCMTHDECLKENDYYDKRAIEIFNLRKSLIQSDLLALKGVNNSFLHHLDQIVNQAALYENYDIILMALYRKRERFIIFKGYDEYLKIKNKIEYYEDCRASLNKVKEYYSFCFQNLLPLKKMQEFQLGLPEIISDLKCDYARTRSKSIGYYLFYIENYYLDRQGKILEKIELLNELIKYLSTDRFVSSFYRKGAAYINLSQEYINAYDFKMADDSLLHAKKYFKNNDYNNCTVFELMVLNYYYSGLISKSNNYLIYLIKRISSFKIIPVFILERLKYYTSVISFLNREHKKSIELLLNLSNLEKDKERWNIAFRILRIINHVELENFDQADLLIDNLRKHVSSKTRDKFISERDKLISKVLVSLSLQSYNFKKADKQKRIILDKLENSDPKDSGWKINTPEMIVFHEWFKAKKEQVPYNHEQVMARMKAKYAPVI